MVSDLLHILRKTNSPGNSLNSRRLWKHFQDYRWILTSRNINLTTFLKQCEQDYYISYVPVSLEILEKIGFLKKKFLNTDYALDIRIIENINDFCISSISNYLTPQENNPDIYARQQFVIKAFSVMNNYIGSLLSVYISKEGGCFPGNHDGSKENT